MLSLAWVFQLDALFRADSFRSSSLSLETVSGFPVHYALEPVSVESVKILVLFDDPPRIYAASLRDVSAWSVVMSPGDSDASPDLTFLYSFGASTEFSFGGEVGIAFVAGLSSGSGT